ncbi:glycosyltransferase family 39 protein [Paucibacter sp. R3-3]|uniref:Glycosyltransferase family 39 protein n=1 Tax=Roseateles agri TaxID=3098619 RepID=A0ABU5DDS2_9BURK|nr:glycosyltransferase family 39 protein [Paucibacter sp. R3-3]MDY0743956.1 glycosyltransferase family 39 protein [Paucibacter sp. R3-3]
MQAETLSGATPVAARRSPGAWARLQALSERTWVAAGLLLLWLGCTAGLRPLMLPDEGRYVGVARHMLDSGDWLTPMLDGLPFFHKPPLFYWLSAGSMALLGGSEFAARLPSLLAAWVACLALFLFVRRWADARLARSSLLALALQPMLFCGAQFANLDMLVAGAITVTVLALAHAQLCREQGLPYRAALLAAYLLAALGVLAKGLIGLALPGLVVIAWLLARGRWRQIVGLLWLPGWLAFLLVAAPWFVLEQQRYPGFLHYVFVEQQFQRFAGTGFNNVQPLWFYPAVLAAFSLPWLYWMLRHLRDAARDLGSPPPVPQHPVNVLMWAWPAVVLLFFSLPQSKLIGYILPAVPPLAYWAAAALHVSDEPTRAQRTGWRWSQGLALACCLAIVATLAIRHTHSARAIGRALAASRQPGEPVLMVGAFAYDVPQYAGLHEPVLAVDDWRPELMRQRDDWARELADASLFDPRRGGELLLAPQQVPALLCRGHAAWAVTQRDSIKLLKGLAHPALVATQGEWQLWRLPPQACPESGR